MRIERVVFQNCDGIAGTFRFPAGGLALGAAPNEGGKTVLTAAIVAALYGESTLRPLAALSASKSDRSQDGSWVMLHLALDSGETLVVARDLATGSVQITDSAGADVSSQYRGSSASRPLGEVLLGLTREEFEETVIVNLQNLRDVFGNPLLAALLDRGENETSDAAQSVEDAVGEPPPAAEDDPTAKAPGDEASPEGDEDFQIVHSSGIEFGMLSEDKVAAAVDDVAAEQEAGLPAGEEEVDSERTGSSPPLAGPAGELQRLKQDHDRLAQEFERKSEELRQHSDRTQELQALLDRVGAIASSEPHDVERLGQLIELMRKSQERERRLARDEKEFHREIGEKGLLPERLEELQNLSSDLDSAEREFLDEYRHTETIRRGNLAIVKSESRLDETQLTEINRSREAGARLAVVPLSVAALALGARLLLEFLPVSFLNPQAFLLLGLLMAIVGLTMFGRAKNRHEKERRTILESLEHKREQLTACEKEDRHVTGRLKSIAELHGADDPQGFLTSYEEWKERRTECRKLASFAKRRQELEEEAGTIREKLGSFAPTEDGGLSTCGAGLANWEALYDEYQQTSEARDKLAGAEETAARLEAELTDLESQRAAVAEAIADLLASTGLDPDKDADEAVEILALRGGSFSVTHPSDAESSPEADEIDLTPPRDPSRPASWQAPLSTRVEAILRRFLSQARDVEIDGRLCPRLRLTPQGRQLELSDLTGRLSAASLDQLCLALRLAIVENLSSRGESLPVLLDDPLVRADDARHDRALKFLVEDAGRRYQVVLLTCHEVRARWFLHQHPQLREAVSSITSQEETEGSVAAAGLAWAALSSPF